MDGNVIYALALTLIAGGATGLGAAMVLLMKRSGTGILAAALGFSAGVMIYISMIEIFSKGKDYLVNEMGEKSGAAAVVIAFFAGIAIIVAVDWLIPTDKLGEKEGNLNHMGLMTAAAIAIHNFPEGMVTFSAALKSPGLGAAICMAIAIHNVPEGIATAVPIYYAGGSKKRAILISCLSGATEPLGAIIGYLLLRSVLNDTVFGIIFGMIAGIMVFISLDELLPMSRAYDSGRVSISGAVAGMLVMAISLLLF